MIYLKVIGFLVLLTGALGVDRYLDSEYNVSLIRETGKALKIVAGNFFTVPELTTPSDFGKSTPAKGTKEIGGPCNSLGRCDKAGEVCEPVTVDDKTELRCVKTAVAEVPQESGSKSGGGVPSVSKPSTGTQSPLTVTASYGKGKVKISSVSVPYSSDYASTITLYSYLNQGEVLSLDGWKVKTKKDEVVIPKAIEVYNPYGGNAAADVKMKAGDYVYIYSSQSKIGTNFRLNKCMGYLETVYKFKPPLSLNCPRLYEARKDIINYTNRCQDYITSLSSCVQPSPNPPIATDDYACLELLNKVNYGGCFSKHLNDADFLSREWRIFLGDPVREREIVDPKHDRVQLFNKAGTLIDEYIY